MFGTLALIIGGAVAAYILWQGGQADQTQNAPVVVKPARPQTPAIEITSTAGTAPTPAAAYLQTINPGIAAGGQPRLIISGKTFYLNEVIAPEFGLKWTRINDQTRELEFTDKQGQRYVKKF